MTRDEPDTRTAAEFRRDLMLSANTEDPATAALERQLLGVVLAHGRALRDTISRASIRPEAFAGPRHRMVWCLVAATCNTDEWYPEAGSVALMLDNQGLDPDGFEEQYLEGLAQADTALATASGLGESPRQRFTRLAALLLDDVADRHLHELRHVQRALHRIAALKAEGDQ